MTYRALAFFDLDGTLLDPHAQIAPEIGPAMAQLKANNILPVIATGRTEFDFDMVRKNTGITSNIAMNGAFIRVEGKELYSEKIDPNVSQRMLASVAEKNHNVSFYNTTNCWSSGHDEATVETYRLLNTPLPEIQPNGYQTQDVHMFLVIAPDGDEYYQETFPELTFYRNLPFSLDTVNKGTSKGTAVERLKKMLHLENVPTFAFGDGINDLPLFEACDYTIAMGNAIDGLKERATFITKKNSDGGIVHGLKHFDLI
ncbi:Cof-type HAD-IIB family hydrolase [Enterococcus olivae]